MKKIKTIVLCSAVMGVAFAGIPATRASSTPTQYTSQTSSQTKAQKQAQKRQVLALAAVLESPQSDDVTKAKACAQLETMGAKAAPAVPALEQVLSSPNATLRGYAVMTLMKIGPAASAAEPQLHTMANTDPDLNVRKAASAAIVSIDSKPNLLKSFFGNVLDLKKKSSSASGSGQPTAAGTTTASDSSSNSPLSQFQQAAAAQATALGIPLGSNTAQSTDGTTPQITGADPNATGSTMGTPIVGTGTTAAPVAPAGTPTVDPNAVNSTGTSVADGSGMTVIPQLPNVQPVGSQPTYSQPTGQQQAGTVVVIDNANPAGGYTNQTPTLGQTVTFPTADPNVNSSAGNSAVPITFNNTQATPASYMIPQSNGQQIQAANPGETTIIIENPNQGAAQNIPQVATQTNFQGNNQPAQTVTNMPQSGSGAWSNQAATGNADWHDLSPQQNMPRQVVIHRVDIPDYTLRANQAVSVLVPEQWTSNVGMTWSQADLASPVEPKFEFHQPMKDEMVKTDPMIFAYWSTNPSAAQNAQPGTLHQGAEVMSTPASWQDALSKVAWPRAHSMQDSPVISFRALPEYAKAYMTQLPRLTNGYKCQLSAGCMRVRYNENSSRTVDEDIVGVFAVITNPATGESNWLVDHIIEFQAPTGQLDSMEKDAVFMVGSVRPHSEWFANYQQTQQYLVARSNSANPNAFPHLTLSQGQPLNAQQTQAMRQYQLSFDESLLALDHGIGGTQYFAQADNSYLPLPAGYGYAWTDGAGNYLLSSTQTPSFPKDNVNAASWLQMTPVQLKRS